MRRFTHPLLALLFLSVTLQPVYAQQSDLQVGESVVVFVLDEGLKLRAGPGIGSPIIENLPSGTVVQIVGGPQTAGGYVWWLIRSPSGNIGWSVERADNIQTLRPIAASQLEGAEVISSAHISASAVKRIVWSPYDDRLLAVEVLKQSIVDVATGNVIQIDDSGRFQQGTVPELTGQTVQWSVDGNYLLEYGNMIGGPVGKIVVDAATGQDRLDRKPRDIQWVDTPEDSRILSVITGPGGVKQSNVSELVITHGGSTLRGGNPALFTSGGRTITLGNGSGGISWLENSRRAVIWSAVDNQAMIRGTAEVWDLVTGVRLAVVPHESNDFFAGDAELSNPAILSRDETMLAAVVFNPPNSGTFGYTLTIYRLPVVQSGGQAQG